MAPVVREDPINGNGTDTIARHRALLRRRLPVHIAALGIACVEGRRYINLPGVVGVCSYPDSRGRVVTIQSWTASASAMRMALPARQQRFLLQPNNPSRKRAGITGPSGCLRPRIPASWLRPWRWERSAFVAQPLGVSASCQVPGFSPGRR